MRLFDHFASGVLCDPISAIIGGVGAGTNLIGSLIGGNAATKASKLQEQQAVKSADTINKASQSVGDAAAAASKGVQETTGQAINRVDAATANANTTLGGVLDKETANLQPYLDAGKQGVTSLAGALAPGGSLTTQFSGPNPQDISSTPEYQFQLQEGLKALQRSASATGSLGTGGTLKAITQYGQGLASTSYQQAYNNALSTFNTNRNNTFQGLTTLANIGQTGTANYNNTLQNFGNNSSTNLLGAGIYGGNALTQAGTYSGNVDIAAANTGLQATESAQNVLMGGTNDRAAGIVGQGNAINAGLGGAANAVTSGLTLGALLKNPNRGGVSDVPWSGIPFA